MANIEIIPYTEVDGIRTYKDSVIKSLYIKIIEEGNGYIFNDGSIQSEDDFLLAMKHRCQLYLAYWDRELVAICWLNRIENKSARIHWCGFDNGSPRQFILIGQKFLKDITEFFDLIIGYTPKSNRQAVRYAKLAGMTPVGEVPNLCWNNVTGKNETGVISYYVRSEEYENL